MSSYDHASTLVLVHVPPAHGQPNLGTVSGVLLWQVTPHLRVALAVLHAVMTVVVAHVMARAYEARLAGKTLSQPAAVCVPCLISMLRWALTQIGLQPCASSLAPTNRACWAWAQAHDHAQWEGCTPWH